MQETLPAGQRFTPQNAPANARKAHRARLGHQLRKALDCQQAAYEAAMTTDVDPKYRASLMRAYHDLTRLVMDMQGQGKPRPVTARNDEQNHTKRRLPSVLPEPVPE